MRSFLYLSGIFSHPVHLYSRDNHTVTAIMWQGFRCDCRAAFPNPTTMELYFHYQNDHQRIRLSTYTEIAIFNGTRVWMSPQHRGQFLLETIVAAV